MLQYSTIQRMQDLQQLQELHCCGGTVTVLEEVSVESVQALACCNEVNSATSSAVAIRPKIMR
jgi:hypothetical protein